MVLSKNKLEKQGYLNSRIAWLFVVLGFTVMTTACFDEPNNKGNLAESAIESIKPINTSGKEIVDEYNIIAVIVPTEEQMQRFRKNNGAVETVEEASKTKSTKPKTKKRPNKEVIPSTK